MNFNKRICMPRMTDWLLITIVLVGIIAAVKPELLPVSIYKLSLISMAAVVGYWVDRSAFPYSRPDGYLCNGVGESWREQVESICINAADVPVAAGYGLVFALAMLRRAIIIAAAMLAASLGV